MGIEAVNLVNLKIDERVLQSYSRTGAGENEGEVGGNGDDAGRRRDQWGNRYHDGIDRTVDVGGELAADSDKSLSGEDIGISMNIEVLRNQTAFIWVTQLLAGNS